MHNDPVGHVDLWGLTASDSNKTDTVPEAPPDVDINQNIEEAKTMSAFDFYEAVRNGGKWDYKQQGSEYQDFGNFNFGATGKAAGFPDEVLKRGAGWAQERAGTSLPEYGDWYGNYPYGDDPDDQEQIQKGIDYYNETNEKTSVTQLLLNSIIDFVPWALCE